VIDITRSEHTAPLFPPRTIGLYLHLATFLVIVLWKVTRDVVTQPRSLVARLRRIAGRASR